MKKATTFISVPEPKAPSISKLPVQFYRNRKKPAKNEAPQHPTEETVDRLNNIGKTYPFCVNYRLQPNDPL